MGEGGGFGFGFGFGFGLGFGFGFGLGDGSTEAKTMAGKAIVRIWNFCLRKRPMSIPKVALSKSSAGRKMTSIT